MTSDSISHAQKLKKKKQEAKINTLKLKLTQNLLCKQHIFYKLKCSSVIRSNYLFNFNFETIIGSNKPY